MSNFIARGGGSGSSLTIDVISAQAYGVVQLLGAGFVASTDATRYVTSVTDSQGGTWVSDFRRIAINTGTDPQGNSLSSGPSFVRDTGADLRKGDTITVHWEGSCTHNIAVACQIGGIRDTITTRYDASTLSQGALGRLVNPYTDNRANASGSGLAGGINYYPGRVITGSNLCELICFVVCQPGWGIWNAYDGTIVDLYVSEWTGPDYPRGALEIVVTQKNVRSYVEFNPGGFFSGNPSGPPYNPNILLCSHQVYDDPLFFNSEPGPVGANMPSGPPLYLGHIQTKKN